MLQSSVSHRVPKYSEAVKWALSYDLSLRWYCSICHFFSSQKGFWHRGKLWFSSMTRSIQVDWLGLIQPKASWGGASQHPSVLLLLLLTRMGRSDTTCFNFCIKKWHCRVSWGWYGLQLPSYALSGDAAPGSPSVAVALCQLLSHLYLVPLAVVWVCWEHGDQYNSTEFSFMDFSYYVSSNHVCLRVWGKTAAWQTTPWMLTSDTLAMFCLTRWYLLQHKRKLHRLKGP